MRVVLAGIGTFGIGWYQLIKSEYPQLQIAIVEVDEKRIARIRHSGDPFYPTLAEAIEREKPDFLLNATPPAVHTRLNHIAFDHRLPVLCEKPIAEDYRQAVEVVARAGREGLPFMVAENYRRLPIMRKTKQLLDEGAIGSLSSIHVQFFQALFTDKPYLLAMSNPLLVDVAVHHLDMLRYLAGSDGKRVFARASNPIGSPYAGNAAVDLILEMENGVRMNYSGNLAAKGAQTDWKGRWRIEGERGLLLVTDEIRLIQEDRETRYTGFPNDLLRPALEDFLAAYSGGFEPETSGRDYLKSQCLVHFAEESNRQGRMLEIELPVLQ